MNGGVTFRDRAAYFEDADVLVVADLHVGRDVTSNVELHLGEHENLTDRFTVLLDRFDPAEVVLAGDVLHSFGSLPRGVLETVAELRRAACEAGVRPVVTPGNHDTMLGDLWDGPITSEYCFGETVVLHGHGLPETEADRYVLGHDHPAITIEGRKYPCYLYGPAQYEGADVLVLPAFNRLVPGVIVNSLTAADFHSPLVVDADTLQPVVRDEEADETLAFPALGQFRRML